MGEKDEKPIRVVDRRMFTPDGELRPDFEPEEPSSSPPPPPPAPAASRPAAPPGPPDAAPRSSASTSPGGAAPRPGTAPAASETEPYDSEGGLESEAGGPPPSSEPRSEFTAIIRSLATTAYSALGLLPDPSGARHREPAVARQMIDWLTVLESKTRNNLSFEESDFLARVLYELRMAFVEVVGPGGGGGAGATRPPGR